MALPSFVHYQRGTALDNAGNTSEAIAEYAKAIEIDNHPMAYYCRACIYKDLRKFKEAIEDFRSYLKYGSETTREGIASRVCIVDENVQGFKGSLKLECPECGQTTIKL